MNIKDLFNTRKHEDTELGFGTRTYHGRIRFINRDGSINTRRKGLKTLETLDIYHYLISTSMINFTLIVFGSYILINTVYACIYYLIGADHFGGIDNATHSEEFVNLFFFSAQSLTTVGYGHIYPKGAIVSSIAALEAMTGLLGFAIATGVLYGRFSKPKATILYSDNILVSPYRSEKAIMFRIANQKRNELIELECQMIVGMNNPETGKRELVPLTLERHAINFLALSWTIVHPLDDNSPLLGVSAEQMMERDAEFIILVKAINETYMQTVHSRSSYKTEDLVWEAKFSPIIPVPDQTGKLVISLHDIHKYDLLDH